jgi:hypothetical protein
MQDSPCSVTYGPIYPLGEPILVRRVRCRGFMPYSLFAQKLLEFAEIFFPAVRAKALDSMSREARLEFASKTLETLK